jgi:aliphatic nitrilase
MDEAMFDFLVKRDPAVGEILKNTSAAESFFISPTGTQIGESIQGKEGIIYAEFNLQECIEPKQFHDVVGYYNRFDIFDLKIDRRRTAPVTWVDDPSE